LHNYRTGGFGKGVSGQVTSFRVLQEVTELAGDSNKYLVPSNLTTHFCVFLDRSYSRR